jgi:hypothetical protein
MSRMPASAMPTRALARRPAERNQNEEVDLRIFQKVDAVRKQRNRADRAGNSELNPEIGEVQNGDEPNGPAQSMVNGYGCHSHSHSVPVARVMMVSGAPTLK